MRIRFGLKYLALELAGPPQRRRSPFRAKGEASFSGRRHQLITNTSSQRYHECYIEYWSLRGRERLCRVRAKHANVRSADTAALHDHSDLVDSLGSDGEEELDEPFESAMSSFESEALGDDED